MKKFQIILGTLFFQFFFSQEVKDYISYIPKDYKIKATSIANAARMIGNAVPPKYAASIGKAIIKNHLNAI